MSSVLFLNQPSVGHLNTLLSIAAQMMEDGHCVRFVLPGLRLPWKRTGLQIVDTALSLPERIRRQGIEAEVIATPWSVLWAGLFLPLKTGYAETPYAVQVMVAGLTAYTRQILAVIERERPDAIVTDFAFPAAALAAEAANVPYAVIYHSGLPFTGPGVPPFGSGLPIGAGAEAVRPFAVQEARMLFGLNARINGVRQQLGLPRLERDFLRHPYSPWLNLVASVEAAEVPRPDLPANTLLIGPCFGKRGTPAAFPWEQLRADRYRVYVSLGTVFNNKPGVFRTILRALDRPEYQVIVSAGGALATLQKEPTPGNALLFPSVPQVELLPRVDLFLSHGGNNSVNEALAAGRPIVVLPIGGEQGDNASRIEYLNVGHRLDLRSLDEGTLRAAVETIRTQPEYGRRAIRLQSHIGATQGLATASRCIAWLADHRRPLQRPADMPTTITPVEWPRLLGLAAL